jgi:hypothetical protein
MPALAANETSSRRVVSLKAAGEERMLEQLDRRVSKMERSIVNILKLSRELLNLAQDKQPEKKDGS